MMRRALWWLAIGVVVCAGAWFFATVPIGGRTLLERILNTASRPDGSPAGDAGRQPAGVGKEPRKPEGADRLTQEDRAKLKELIESRLKEDGKTARPQEVP